MKSRASAALHHSGMEAPVPARRPRFPLGGSDSSSEVPVPAKESLGVPSGGCGPSAPLGDPIPASAGLHPSFCHSTRAHTTASWRARCRRVNCVVETAAVRADDTPHAAIDACAHVYVPPLCIARAFPPLLSQAKRRGSARSTPLERPNPSRCVARCCVRIRYQMLARRCYATRWDVHRDMVAT